MFTDSSTVFFEKESIILCIKIFVASSSSKQIGIFMSLHIDLASIQNNIILSRRGIDKDLRKEGHPGYIEYNIVCVELLMNFCKLSQKIGIIVDFFK